MTSILSKVINVSGTCYSSITENSKGIVGTCRDIKNACLTYLGRKDVIGCTPDALIGAPSPEIDLILGTEEEVKFLIYSASALNTSCEQKAVQDPS